MRNFTKTRGSCIICHIALILGLMTLLPGISAAQQKTSISGTVLEQSGAPIAGVSVLINGTTTGTITDGKGAFTIKADPNAMLTISFLGYQKQEIVASKANNAKIYLREDSHQLSDIVVVGYGTQKKATMTGAVAQVKAEDIMKSPVANMSQALTGRATGLTTIQQSGEPGADGVTLLIRGTGTLSSSSSSPLILVDGVERSFTQIDPNEVESISVLKDAASTAVFGIRGANGVIIVTTKQGTEGPARVSFSANVALQQVARMPDRVDAETYCLAFNEALYNDSPASGKFQRFSASDIQKYKAQSDPLLYPEHNWVDDMMRKVALQQNYNINISGGTKNAKYFISLGYFNQDGLLKDVSKDVKSLEYTNNVVYNRYNIRSNIDVNVTPTTTIGAMISGIIQNREYATNDPFMWMLGAPPIASPFISAGKIISTVGIPDVGASPYANMMSGLTKNARNTLTITLKANQKLDFITKGLSMRGIASYDSFYQQTSTTNQPVVMYQPVTNVNPNGEMELMLKQIGENGILANPSESFDRYQMMHAEAAMEYKRTINSHTIGALFLGTLDRKWYKKNTNQNIGTYQIIPITYSGLVGRLTYNYKGKYLAEFNIGYNGSENFPPDNRFAWFPAVSAGWNMAEEKFFQSIISPNIVSKLKLRGSYGVVGNDDSGNARFMYYQGAYTNGGGAYFGSSNQIYYQGFNEGRLGNSAITWETAYKSNFGLELGLFKNKLSLEFEYFYDKRRNILDKIYNESNQTAVQGQDVYNIAKVDNKGFESSIRWSDKRGGISYWVGGNFSFARNKIVFVDEVIDLLNPQLRKTGKRVGEMFGYISDGFFNNWDEVNRGPVYGSTMPGDVRYVDINGDGVINDRDRAPIGHPSNPEITYSFSGGISYKRFDFSCMFQGAENTYKLFSENFRNPFLKNVGILQYMYDERWTPETASTAKRPRLTKNYNTNSYENSDVWYSDASYLKLRNVEIAYTLDKNNLKGLGVKRLRIYLSGQNLFTWSPIKTLDPEGRADDAFKYPQLRVYNIGIKLDF